HNRERTELIGINVTKSTCQKYYITRKLVADFILYRYNLHDIPIKEINHQFISDFDAYLLSKCNYSKNNVITVLKKFRHIIEVALNKEWITRNPFKDYRMTWEKVDRGYLTQSELETLIDFQFEEKRLDKARDIFIFCAFTGLAFIDVKHLTNSHIQSSVEGKVWIRGKRQKTGTDFNIPVLNIPKMILDKYKGKTKGDFVLPVFRSNTHYNLLLKKMAKLCAINKNVSSHLARHSFATLALTKGVTIETVGKMLGHTNINTTQIYARITDKKIGNEMNTFAEKVKRLDIKMQITAGQQELTLEDLLKSIKISTGKAADVIWENLTLKIWGKLSNIEKQSFASEVKNIENKPKTIRDFYVFLMDYFLDGFTDQNNNPAFSGNESFNGEINSVITL
ncbi:MAG: site-specific integrase, partial [Candidatus Azobacteroides sp.]|nr:site-specific integrase [Candidatus Azobacteroides sp.]